MRIRLRHASIVLAVVAACNKQPSALPYYADASLTPQWKTATDSLYRVSDLAFVDQTGAPFTADSLTGHVHVAQFFFSRCGDIYPVITKHLQQVAATFAHDDFLITSYSVSPHADSVAQLNAYARRVGMDNKHWRLLTGDSAITTRAATAYLVGRGRGRDYGVDSVAHTEMLVLVDAQRHVRGVYNGTLELDVRQMVLDARQLLDEASHDTPTRSRLPR